LGSPLLFYFPHPRLFPADVQVMAARLEGRFDHARAMIDKRSHGVADHFGPGEQLGQFVHTAAGFGHLVVGGLNPRDTGHDLFQPLAGASRGDESNVVFAQILSYQAARKTVGAIDHHRTLLSHASAFANETWDLPEQLMQTTMRRPPSLAAGLRRLPNPMLRPGGSKKSSCLGADSKLKYLYC